MRICEETVIRFRCITRVGSVGMLIMKSSFSRVAARTRALSSLARKPLTLEQALTSNHLVLSELEAPAMKQQLEAVRANGDILAKWQATNGVLVHATLRTLPQLGYSADANGLQAYSDAFAECLRNDSPEVRSTLRGLNESKWRVLLKHAFGCEPAPPLSLTQARTIAIDMVDALQDDALLKQVEEAKSGLAARLPEAERQHMVARALVSVQSEVVSKHGFTGDEGYAQAQVCLMEHAADAVVTASIAAATSNIYARAGINLQEALRNATGGNGP